MLKGAKSRLRAATTAFTATPALDLRAASRELPGWAIDGDEVWALGKRIPRGGITLAELGRVYRGVLAELRDYRIQFNCDFPDPTVAAVELSKAGNLLAIPGLRVSLTPIVEDGHPVSLVVNVPISTATIELHLVRQSPVAPHAAYCFLVREYPTPLGPRDVWTYNWSDPD